MARAVNNLALPNEHEAKAVDARQVGVAALLLLLLLLWLVRLAFGIHVRWGCAAAAAAAASKAGYSTMQLLG